MSRSVSRSEPSETVWLAKRSLLLCGAISLVMYWPILLGRVPFPAKLVTQFPPWDSVRPVTPNPPPIGTPHAEMGDLVTELYPWKAYTRRAITSGTFPLWNPNLLLGAPFLGDMQTGLFYPLNWIYFVLPTPLAWSLSVLLRTVLAGILATLLASRLGATRTSSLLAGVIFAFCGWVTAFQTRPHLDTSLWLPLVLLSIDRLQRRPAGSSVALAGAAFALPVLAGQPENAAHVTLVALLFFLFRLGWPPGRETTRLRFTGLFAAAGMLGVALAAIQILPGLEFISQLERSLTMPWGPKPLREIAAFLSRDLYSNPNSAGVVVPESAAYAGMLTLLLAPLAWMHSNRRDVLFFAVLLICALSVVYGTGPVYWLSLHTPILQGIPNGRLLVVADLCLAVLAALALSALESRRQAARNEESEPRDPGRSGLSWWTLPTAALAICVAGVGLVLQFAKPELRGGGPGNWTWLRSPISSAVVLAAAAAMMALSGARRLSRHRFAQLALAFCAADLATAGFAFLPFCKPAEIFPPTATFDFLRRDPEPHRVATVGRTWGSSFESMYGLQSATGYTVLIRRLTRFFFPLGLRDENPYLVAEDVAASRTRLLDLANVKYLAATTWNSSAELLAAHPDRYRLVFSDVSVRVFENLSVLPRAFLVPATGVRVVTGGERPELLAVREPDLDPRRTVLLPAPPPPIGSGTPVENPGVTSYSQSLNAVALNARVAEPSLLVVSQMHYPGWKAIVDGKDASLLRADYAFVAVALAPGAHAVRIVYEPASFRAGAALSVAGLLVAISACFARRRETSVAPTRNAAT
ncbi:MAG TPA: YfhO family protein [Thermoanaerobaculia bacterium]